MTTERQVAKRIVIRINRVEANCNRQDDNPVAQMLLLGSNKQDIERIRAQCAVGDRFLETLPQICDVFQPEMVYILITKGGDWALAHLIEQMIGPDRVIIRESDMTFVDEEPC